MCDSTMMQEYGLVGSFDTVAMMSGERIAIVMKRNPNNSFFYTPEDNFEQTETCLVEEDSLNRESECSDDDESEVEEVELQGMSYTEIQYFSQSLSKQLYYRFGVRTGDRVILACQSHACAEVVAMLACARIGAIFVPIDYSWLHSDKSRLASIIQDATPSAAVVVGDDDRSEVVLALGKLGVYRCALVTNEGSQVEQDASVSSTTENQFSEYNPEEAREKGEKEVPLYILYTSGSTGEPKGVLGTYKGLINRICWQIDKYPWQIGEVACRRTPLTFVDAMAEIFGALLCCVPLFLPDAEKMKSEGVNGIAEEANSAGVTRITLLPSQLYMACKLNSDIGSTWPKLRYVYISGEECQWLLVELFRKVFPNCTLINLYGSTEVAGDVTFAELYKPDSSNHIDSGNNRMSGTSSGGSGSSGTIICSGGSGNSDVMSKCSHCVPIGLPIKNNYLFIVKRTENTSENTTNTNTTAINMLFSLCKDGEEGELMVLGEHVSAGYYNRPLENSQKFIDNPLRNMSALPSNSDMEEALKFEKAFLTGDLVVRDPSTHEFIWICRLDRQVKIRGVRIELEDVERSICRVCQVADGIAVIAVKTTNNSNSISTVDSSTNMLVLFIEQNIVNHTMTSNKNIDSGNSNDTTSSVNNSNSSSIPINTPTCSTVFRQFLSSHLSAYMLPIHIIAVDSLPRTVSKKVDRQQLTRQYYASISGNKNDNNNNSSDNGSDNSSNNKHENSSDNSSNKDNVIDINSITQSELRNLLFKTFISVLPKETVESITFSTATTANLTSIDHTQHSFISLGGDSMTSIEVIYKLRSILGGKIHLKYEDLVNNSIEQLAEYIYKLVHSDVNCNSPTSEEGDVLQQANKKQKMNYDLDLNTTKCSISASNSNITVCHNKISSDNIVEAYAVSRASHTTKQNTVNNASNNVHNNIVNNNSVSGNSNELKVVWKCPLLKCVDSSPLVVVRSYGNSDSNADIVTHSEHINTSSITVYIGSHGGDFTAVDGNSGAIHWQTQLRQHIEAAATANHSCSLIYIVSYAGKDVDGYEGTAVLDSQSGEPCLGTIWALNAYDGTVVWKHHTAGELKGAVTIDHQHNLLFCGSYDGNLYCLEASSGRELSRVACHGAIFASPVLSSSKNSDSSGSDIVYVVTTSGLVQAISVEIISNVDTTTITNNSENITVKMSVIGVYSTDSSPIFSTPIVVNTASENEDTDSSNRNDIIDSSNSGSGFGNSVSGEFVLFGVIDGSIRAVNFESTVAADTTVNIESAEAECGMNDSEACYDGEQVNLLDNLPLKSTELWRVHNSHGAVFSSPCLVPTARKIDSESHVAVSDNYDGGSDKAVQLTNKIELVVGGASFIVGSHDGRLRHIGIATGTLLWEVNLNIVIFSAPFCTTTHCIVTTTAGEVIVLCVRTGEILSKLRLAGEIYSSPVVVNGFVYVGCRDDHVYCLKK